MTADLLYLVVGIALCLALVLPVALQRLAVSAPMVLLGFGVLVGLLPLKTEFSPAAHPDVAEHLTELCVLVALMGVGLALDRPLSLRRWSTWREWSGTWRLLGVTMPLTIAAVALLGWGVLGLAPASALLLGAALSPTDPVLASDVQVGGPTSEEDSEEIEETDEVRFALTSEAGLNDALAFPFVYAALLLATVGSPLVWGWHWLGWELLGKVLLGAAVGVGCGWVVSRIAFRAPQSSLRVAELGEPLLALATLLLAYGAAEVVGGYGFLSVFTSAMTMRSMERHSHYHGMMHEMVERLERLVTLVVLLLFGVSLTDGILSGLTGGSVLVAVALVLVVRPLAGWVALAVAPLRENIAGRPVPGLERWVIGFFGVRGIGTLYYLAYATGKAAFPDADRVWATAALAIVLSVVVHGVTATPVMTWLERVRERRGREPAVD